MPAKQHYDLVIIGSGPGGYVAAVRATQLGMKTAVVEKGDRLGGVCLNVGCIPSKALLDASEYYHLAADRLSEYGIKTGKVSLDLKTMMARKDKVVSDLTANVRKLLEGNGIEILPGTASLAGDGGVEIKKGKGRPKKVSAQNILLATGSKPVQVPGLEFDGSRIVDSTGALNFKSVPKHLGIVGGGYIGLELGSIWLRLGARVTVIEMLPRIAGLLDGQVGRSLDRLLRKQGFTFLTSTKVAGAKVKGGSVAVAVAGKEKAETLAR